MLRLRTRAQGASAAGVRVACSTQINRLGMAACVPARRGYWQALRAEAWVLQLSGNV
jgi:hypothetical protein